MTNITAGNNGIVNIRSSHNVADTVERIKDMLRSRGVTLFAVIDHSGEAQKIGMKMPATQLLIFGNPNAGTPLMLAAPSIAIDLPSKILVSQDKNLNTWISYNSPDYLKERHGIPPELLGGIEVVESFAANAVKT